jgi:Zn-dependent M32 family carboxypeptidase
MNIGFILIDNINNKLDLDKVKLMNEIQKYNKDKKLMNELRSRKIEEYNKKYEQSRKTNQDNYNLYLTNYNKKYKKWTETNNIKDLYELVSVKKPDLIEVPEIYSIGINK